MSRALIIVGLAIAAVDSIWLWIGPLGLGRPSRRHFIQRDNFTSHAR
jgi:hypothetical protein